MQWSTSNLLNAWTEDTVPYICARKQGHEEHTSAWRASHKIFPWPSFQKKGPCILATAPEATVPCWHKVLATRHARAQLYVRKLRQLNKSDLNVFEWQCSRSALTIGREPLSRCSLFKIIEQMIALGVHFLGGLNRRKRVVNSLCVHFNGGTADSG